MQCLRSSSKSCVGALWRSEAACERARRLHTLQPLRPSGPFNILFLGRDEFSVLVLDQLYQNSGKAYMKYLTRCSSTDLVFELGRCME